MQNQSLHFAMTTLGKTARLTLHTVVGRACVPAHMLLVRRAMDPPRFRQFGSSAAAHSKPIDYAANPFGIGPPEDDRATIEARATVLVQLRRAGLLRNTSPSDEELTVLEERLLSLDRNHETRKQLLSISERTLQSEAGDFVASSELQERASALFESLRAQDEGERPSVPRRASTSGDYDDLVTDIPISQRNRKLRSSNSDEKTEDSVVNDRANEDGEAVGTQDSKDRFYSMPLDPVMVRDLRSMLLPAKYMSMFKIGFTSKNDMKKLQEMWNCIVLNKVSSYVRQVRDNEEIISKNVPKPPVLQDQIPTPILIERLVEELTKYGVMSESLVFSDTTDDGLMLTNALPVRAVWEGKTKIQDLDPVTVPKSYQLLFHPLAAVDIANPERFINYIAGLFDACGHVYVDKRANLASIEFKTFDKYERLFYYLKRFIRYCSLNKTGEGHVILRFTHKKGILRLLRLLNGRVHTPILQSGLMDISQMYGVQGLFKPPMHSISPDSMWLSGYFEINGRFGVSLKYNKVFAYIRSPNLGILKQIRDQHRFGYIRPDPNNVEMFSQEWVHLCSKNLNEISQTEGFSTHSDRSGNGHSGIKSYSYVLEIYRHTDLVSLKAYLFNYPMKGPQKYLSNIFHRVWLFLDRGYLNPEYDQPEWKRDVTFGLVNMLKETLPPVERVLAPSSRHNFNPELPRRFITQETRDEMEFFSTLSEDTQMSSDIQKSSLPITINKILEPMQKFTGDQDIEMPYMEKGWIHQGNYDIYNTALQLYHPNRLQDLTYDEIISFARNYGNGLVKFRLITPDEIKDILAQSTNEDGTKDSSSNDFRPTKFLRLKTLLNEEGPPMSTRQQRFLAHKLKFVIEPGNWKGKFVPKDPGEYYEEGEEENNDMFTAARKHKDDNSINLIQSHSGVTIQRGVPRNAELFDNSDTDFNPDVKNNNDKPYRSSDPKEDVETYKDDFDPLTEDIEFLNSEESQKLKSKDLLEREILSEHYNKADFNGLDGQDMPISRDRRGDAKSKFGTTMKRMASSNNWGDGWEKY